MDAREYLCEIKNTYKTYSHLKLALQNCSKEEFDELCNDVITQIFIDEKKHNEFIKTSSSITVVEKEYSDLCRYSMTVLNFFNLFKQIKGY